MVSPGVRLFLYVGCGNASGDILTFALDPATAALTPVGTTASGSSTSFLALHPTRRFVYTTQNRSDQLTALALDGGTGLLTVLNQVPIAGAPGTNQAGPAYLEVDAAGGYLLAANYRGHNLVVHRLQPDGLIGPRVGTRSDGRHAHAVRLDPSNRFAFVPHLGSDLIAQLRFDAATGALAPNTPAAVTTAAGAGPRHLDFHPSGRFLYVVNELDATVDVYAFDQHTGTLARQQTVSALPDGYTGRRWSSDLHVHPTGRFLYAANRAHDSLAVFGIDPGSGRLTPLGHQPVLGQTPRGFSLDPAGRFVFVANQDSANVATFAIDERTGQLAAVGTTTVPENPYFARVVALPA